MAEQTDAAPQQPKSGWRTLVDTVVGWPISRKIALAAVTVITLGLFAFIIVQARTADYQLLYGNLADSDASAVVDDETLVAAVSGRPECAPRTLRADVLAGLAPRY